jgi:hypothetical protein
MKLKCTNGNEDFVTTRLVAEETNVLFLVQRARNLMERERGDMKKTVALLPKVTYPIDNGHKQLES